MKLFVDSNVYISAFQRNDILHDAAERFFEYLSYHPHYESVLFRIVSFEVMNVLMKLGKHEQEISSAFQIMLRSSSVIKKEIPIFSFSSAPAQMLMFLLLGTKLSFVKGRKS